MSAEKNTTDGGPEVSTSKVSEPPTFSQQWTQTITENIHRPILNAMHPVTQTVANNPWRTVTIVPILSLLLLLIGAVTGLYIETDGDKLWTPQDSRPIRHKKWIDDQSGFPIATRPMLVFFHNNGGNVLGQDQVAKVFEAFDAIRNIAGYDEVCSDSDFVGSDGTTTCEIDGVPQFWNLDVEQFNSEVNSDEDVIQTLSALTFPDGKPVPQDGIFGFPQRDSDGELLENVVSFTLLISLPDTTAAEDFEEKAIEVILDLDDTYEAQEESNLRVEITAERSFADEFERAILRDLPLIPFVFIIMSIFCALFFRKDRRALLGFLAVISVFCSIISGFGFLWICQISFTSMTQILPYVIFGIGLDDAFVIYVAYSRLPTDRDILDRIRETIQDVGVSITLTTLTSSLAFGLGCLSSVPAVYWLCLYAFPTIIFVYLYQITFFIACIVLDDRRTKANRRDCLVCCKAQGELPSIGDQDTAFERFIAWYADIVVATPFKIVVVISFGALAALCAWRTSLMEVQFDFTDVIPEDSYVADFLDTFDVFSSLTPVNPRVYFRFVDQSNPEVQQQMLEYIEGLVGAETITNPPDFFWLRDFTSFVNSNETISTLGFTDQMAAFLEVPVFFELYQQDIVLDEAGNVTASRCLIFMDNVDTADVKSQTDALEEQQQITGSQPLNTGLSNWRFFMYNSIFNIWEFYTVSVDELILTTILGIVSVVLLTFAFIPHWSAAIFVAPLICVLYVDLLGFLQWVGVRINPVSYITMVMSIGLLVDFIMHILLRFYEVPGNRIEKTKETIKSMGSSVLVGGISTFLGTLPLALSTSEIIGTVFWAFLGLSVLGCAHGLVVLPVVLSSFGPEDVATRAMAETIKLERPKEAQGMVE